MNPLDQLINDQLQNAPVARRGNKKPIKSAIAAKQQPQPQVRTPSPVIQTQIVSLSSYRPTVSEFVLNGTIPKEFKLQDVKDNGDCMFESVAIGLNNIGDIKRADNKPGAHSVATLREDCRRFGTNIFKKKYMKPASDTTPNENIFLDYLFQEIDQPTDIIKQNVLGDYNIKIIIKAGTDQIPIWGETKELMIFAELYRVVIHVFNDFKIQSNKRSEIFIHFNEELKESVILNAIPPNWNPKMIIHIKIVDDKHVNALILQKIPIRTPTPPSTPPPSPKRPPSVQVHPIIIPKLELVKVEEETKEPVPFVPSVPLVSAIADKGDSKRQSLSLPVSEVKEIPKRKDYLDVVRLLERLRIIGVPIYDKELSKATPSMIELKYGSIVNTAIGDAVDIYYQSIMKAIEYHSKLMEIKQTQLDRDFDRLPSEIRSELIRMSTIKVRIPKKSETGAPSKRKGTPAKTKPSTALKVPPKAGTMKKQPSLSSKPSHPISIVISEVEFKEKFGNKIENLMILLGVISLFDMFKQSTGPEIRTNIHNDMRKKRFIPFGAEITPRMIDIIKTSLLNHPSVLELVQSYYFKYIMFGSNFDEKMKDFKQKLSVNREKGRDVILKMISSVSDSDELFNAITSLAIIKHHYDILLTASSTSTSSSSSLSSSSLFDYIANPEQAINKLKDLGTRFSKAVISSFPDTEITKELMHQSNSSEYHAVAMISDLFNKNNKNNNNRIMWIEAVNTGTLDLIKDHIIKSKSAFDRANDEINRIRYVLSALRSKDPNVKILERVTNTKKMSIAFGDVIKVNDGHLKLQGSVVVVPKKNFIDDGSELKTTSQLLDAIESASHQILRKGTRKSLNDKLGWFRIDSSIDPLRWGIGGFVFFCKQRLEGTSGTTVYFIFSFNSIGFDNIISILSDIPNICGLITANKINDMNKIKEILKQQQSEQTMLITPGILSRINFIDIRVVLHHQEFMAEPKNSRDAADYSNGIANSIVSSVIVGQSSINGKIKSGTDVATQLETKKLDKQAKEKLDRWSIICKSMAEKWTGGRSIPFDENDLQYDTARIYLKDIGVGNYDEFKGAVPDDFELIFIYSMRLINELAKKHLDISTRLVNEIDNELDNKMSLIETVRADNAQFAESLRFQLGLTDKESRENPAFHALIKLIKVLGIDMIKKHISDTFNHNPQYQSIAIELTSSFSPNDIANILLRFNGIDGIIDICMSLFGYILAVASSLYAELTGLLRDSKNPRLKYLAMMYDDITISLGRLNNTNLILQLTASISSEVPIDTSSRMMELVALLDDAGLIETMDSKDYDTLSEVLDGLNEETNEVKRDQLPSQDKCEVLFYITERNSIPDHINSFMNRVNAIIKNRGFNIINHTMVYDTDMIKYLNDLINPKESYKNLKDLIKAAEDAELHQIKQKEVGLKNIDDEKMNELQQLVEQLSHKITLRSGDIKEIEETFSKLDPDNYNRYAAVRDKTRNDLMQNVVLQRFIEEISDNGYDNEEEMSDEFKVIFERVKNKRIADNEEINDIIADLANIDEEFARGCSVGVAEATENANHKMIETSFKLLQNIILDGGAEQTQADLDDLKDAEDELMEEHPYLWDMYLNNKFEYEKKGEELTVETAKALIDQLLEEQGMDDLTYSERNRTLKVRVIAAEDAVNGMNVIHRLKANPTPEVDVVMFPLTSDNYINMLNACLIDVPLSYENMISWAYFYDARSNINDESNENGSNIIINNIVAWSVKRFEKLCRQKAIPFAELSDTEPHLYRIFKSIRKGIIGNISKLCDDIMISISNDYVPNYNNYDTSSLVMESAVPPDISDEFLDLNRYIDSELKSEHKEEESKRAPVSKLSSKIATILSNKDKFKGKQWIAECANLIKRLIKPKEEMDEEEEREEEKGESLHILDSDLSDVMKFVKHDEGKDEIIDIEEAVVSVETFGEKQYSILSIFSPTGYDLSLLIAGIDADGKPLRIKTELQSLLDEVKLNEIRIVRLAILNVNTKLKLSEDIKEPTDKQIIKQVDEDVIINNRVVDDSFRLFKEIIKTTNNEDLIPYGEITTFDDIIGYKSILISCVNKFHSYQIMKSFIDNREQLEFVDQYPEIRIGMNEEMTRRRIPESLYKWRIIYAVHLWNCHAPPHLIIQINEESKDNISIGSALIQYLSTSDRLKNIDKDVIKRRVLFMIKVAVKASTNEIISHIRSLKSDDNDNNHRSQKLTLLSGIDYFDTFAGNVQWLTRKMW